MQIWTVLGAIAGIVAAFSAVMFACFGMFGKMLTAEFRAFRSEITSEMDRRFTLVDQRFEAMEHRFEAMEHRFEAMEHRFEAIDKHLDYLDTDVHLIKEHLLAKASA